MAEIKIFGKDGLVDLGNAKNLEQAVTNVKNLSKSLEELERNLLDLKKANDQSLKQIVDEAKSLKQVIVAQKDYNDTVADASKKAKALNEANKKLKQNNEDLKSQLEKLKEEKKKLNEVEKEGIRLSKQEQTLLAKKELATSDQAKRVAELREETNRLNRLNREAAKASQDETNAYKRKSRELNNLRNKYKAIRAAEGKATDATKKLRIEIDKLDRELKDIDAEAGQFQRSVGNYEKALRGVSNGATNLLSTMLPIATATAAVSAGIGEAFSFFQQFDLVMGKVAATTNATESQITKLRTSAQDLGSVTKFTATEVGQLQLEFSKLGFTTDQILNATEATLNLATAADTDLARSAEVVAATINQFGLSAEESTRITDVMAKSFSSSALDIEKFATSMAIVGPAAQSVGQSVEGTTAILGKIVDAGVDASSAGSALRNIFIDLSDKGLTWDDAMNKIRNSQDKLNTANELFGKRGAVVAKIISDNADSISVLEDNLLNATGAAKEMADIVGDNLAGDVDRLSSAWEGLVSQGTLLNKIFRDTIQAITSMLGGLTSLIKGSKDYSNGLNDEVEAIQKTKIELNNKLEVLKDENLTNEQRKILIQDINREYPELINNQLTEASTLEDIVRLQKEANAQLLNKLRLKREEAKQVEIANKILDLEERELELNKAIVQNNIKIESLRGRELKAEKARLRANQERLTGIKSEIELLKEQLKVNVDLETQKDRQDTKAEKVSVATKEKDDKQKKSSKEDQVSEAIQDNTLKERLLVIQQEYNEGLITQQEYELLNLQIKKDGLDLAIKELELQLLFEDNLAKRSELEGKLLDLKKESLELEKQIGDAIVDNAAAKEKVTEVEKKGIQEVSELQKGVAGAASSILQAKMKNQIAAVVIDSVLGAIERGEDPTSALGKATFIKSALLAIVNSGFHSGGYTGDGEKMQPAGIVHKGEFVIDKQKTAELGLRNKSMKDFNYMIENDMLSRDKNISDNVELNMLNRQVQVVKQDIDYDQMGQSIAKHMPKEQLKHVGELLAHEISTGNKKEITIFKGRKLNTY